MDTDNNLGLQSGSIKAVEMDKARAKKKPVHKKQRQKPGKNRLSQRPYPRVPLSKTLSIPLAIKEKNGGNPWPAEQLAKVVGLSPKNVDFYYLLLSSQKFGLTSGTKTNGEVSLTELGRQLVYSGSAEEELLAKQKALLSVEIFKSVLEYYRGNRLPEMQYLGNTLQDKFQLPPEFHEEFSRLFHENCESVGWTEGVELDSDNNGSSLPATPMRSKDVVIIGEPRQRTGGTCFVIMPFKEHSDNYAKGFFEEVLSSLIIPAATEAGFEVKTANRQGTEIIHSTIVSEVLDADLCVCDLTEHNPNVLFELGIRLAHEKPVALIHAEGTARVFDVDNILRVFAYKKELWRTTLQKDIPDLKAHISATWDNRNTTETYLSVLRKPAKAKAAAATA